MNDCPNADVRDLLPDLVHGRLDETTRARMESHLAGCADCRSELSLLRDVRAATLRTPGLDLGAIAAVVPAYRTPVRRSWAGWRTAAAVTLIVAGGSSIIVTQRLGTNRQDSVVVPVISPSDPVPNPRVIASTPTSSSAPSPAAAVDSSVRPTPTVAPVVAPVERELAMSGGGLTDLSDRELTSLLKEIESLDAVPSTDVESVPLAPIAPRRGTP